MRAAEWHTSRPISLQATALVHEVYLRLLGDNARLENRAHFLVAAAEAMRRILIEHARKKQALKNGGGCNRVELHGDLPEIETPAEIDDLLSLDEALERPEREAPDQASLVKLLYFAGLNLEDAAQLIGVSRTTAYRRWQFARAWLFAAISGVGP